MVYSLHANTPGVSFRTNEDVLSKCANCGKNESEAGHLKTCIACKMVKYCSRECQAAQWPLHKKQCKIRAAEISRGRMMMDAFKQMEVGGDSVAISTPPKFEIGSRVNCPLLHLVNGYEKLDRYTGTVIKHNVKLGKGVCNIMCILGGIFCSLVLN